MGDRERIRDEQQAVAALNAAMQRVMAEQSNTLAAIAVRVLGDDEASDYVGRLKAATREMHAAANLYESKRGHI